MLLFIKQFATVGTYLLEHGVRIFFLKRIMTLLFYVTMISIVLSFLSLAHAISPEFFEKPVRGDSIIMPLSGEPSNLLPFMATDLPSHGVATDFFIAPLKYDKNLEITTWAAESYSVLDGGLRLRFVLKKGIHWSDGVEFTADDIEFTYKLMIDPKTPTVYSDDYKAIKRFNRIDKYTFEVTYEKPYPRALTTWMLEVMPKHALQGANLQTTPLSRNPISCGPYTLEKWEAGAQLRLTSNPQYFDGAPYVDGVVYRIIPDATTQFMELMAGNIDIISDLSPFQTVYQTQKTAFTEKFDIYEWLASAYTYLGYNLKSPLFSDVRVRQALAYAIDKNDIVSGALFGQGVSITGPYKPDSWAYNTNIHDREYNTQKALTLLADVGWVQDSQGMLKNKKGEPFQFTVLVDQGNETRSKVGLILQEQLKKIGITVKIRTVEWATFINQFVMKGFFDAVILGWSIPLDPDNYQVWHTATSSNSLNFVGYSNKEVDDLLEKARSTFDQDTRKKFYDRVQEILHEEQPYCFLFVPYSISAVNKRFKGLEKAPSGIFHNMNEWWVPLPDQRYRLAR